MMARMEADSMSVASSNSQTNNLVLVRIGVPELNVEKCLQYHKDEVIWEVKQQALAALPKVKPICIHTRPFMASVNS